MRFLNIVLGLIVSAMLSIAAQAAPSTANFGVDRTVTPWQVCFFDQNNICQPFLYFPATGGNPFVPPQFGGTGINGPTGLLYFSGSSTPTQYTIAPTSIGGTSINNPTGFVYFNGASAPTQETQITLTQLPTMAAHTFMGNGTGSPATPTALTAIPNGITATTQALSDNTTSVATDAFAQAIIVPSALTFAGVDPTGGANSTTGLNNAIAAACTTQHALRIPAGTYKFTALTGPSAGSWGDCWIMGDGRGQTILIQTTSGDGLTFTGSGTQKLKLTGMTITEQANGTKTSGYAIVLNELYYPLLDDVDINGYNGIYDEASTEMTLGTVNFGYLNGSEGLYFKGVSAGAAVFGAHLLNVTGTTSNSGGVSTNTALKWIDNDSYAYSITISYAAFQYGLSCAVMEDSVAAGGNASVPSWLTAVHLECDHQYNKAIDLIKGFGYVQDSGSWIGSVTNGPGIVQESTFIGQTVISGSRINGNFQQGVEILGGADTKLIGNTITANGNGTGGVHYDEVLVAAGVSNLKAQSNFISATGESNSSTDLFCLDFASGSGNHIDISGNTVNGCISGSISQGATGTNVSINNNDGYNQGTWTPVLAGATTAGTFTYTTQAGFYKVANGLVTASATVITSAVSGSPTGNAIIKNLPFASSSTSNQNGACTIALVGGYTFTTNFTQLGAQVAVNNNAINIYESGSGQAVTFLPIGNIGASSEIIITCSYMQTP